MKQILDRHSQEVQEDMKRKKNLGPRTTLSKNERPNCNDCKYPLKSPGRYSRCKDPQNCTMKRFQGIAITK